MKIKRVIVMEDDDVPSPKHIRESFSRLGEMANALWIEDSPIRKAFHRIVDNKEFVFEDVETLVDYGKKVAAQALDKYRVGEMAGAPWAESVTQAANNLHFCMEEFRDRALAAMRQQFSL